MYNMSSKKERKERKKARQNERKKEGEGCKRRMEKVVVEGSAVCQISIRRH